MFKLLKLLHLVGVAAFVGSVFGHIVSGLTVPWSDDAMAVLTARAGILDITNTVTLPGLAVAVATGFAMMALKRIDPRRAPWLAVHAGLGLLIVANALLLVVPAGRVMAAEAAKLGGTAFDALAYLDALKVEAIAGGVNLLMAVIAMALAIAKPAWRRYRASRLSNA